MPNGARDLRSNRIAVGETGRRPREIGIEREPRPRTVVVRPLHAKPSGWVVPASVVPASPTKTSSESRARPHTATVVWSFGIRIERTPNSPPRVRTSGVTLSAGSPVAGSMRDRRSAGIVAVIAVAEVAVQLEPGRGREHDAELGTDETR